MAELTRRGAIVGLGVTGAATVLAACSTYGNKTTPSSTSTKKQSNGPVDLGSTSDVPLGGGKIFDTQKVVVTQPTQNQFKCFTAICTHLGCTVGTVQGGTINCPCHGSRYSIKDGSVVNGPAPAPLAAEPITVKNGQISLNE